MRRMLVFAVCVGVMGGAMAEAGTMKGLRGWAAKIGAKEVARVFAVNGMTNAAEQAAATAGWDEDVFVDVVLKNRAYGLVKVAWAQDQFSAANRERIRIALLGEKETPEVAADMVALFPPAERGALKAAVEPIVARRYLGRPEFARCVLKYTVMEGVVFPSAAASEDDLIAFLLAAEPAGIMEVDAAKRMIKERAIVKARLALREEGKSFVVKDGVNPLVAKLQPVVDALNAPACEGIEAAVRGLGAEVGKHERGEMKKLCDIWQTQVMRGDLLGDEIARRLGRIAVALGADGYNRFVDEYNNGKAAGK